MKFKFIGKPTLIVDTLTTNKIYRILQFEHTARHILAYIVDNKNEIICVPYSSMETFNQNWSFVNDQLL